MISLEKHLNNSSFSVGLSSLNCLVKSNEVGPSWLTENLSSNFKSSPKVFGGFDNYVDLCFSNGSLGIIVDHYDYTHSNSKQMEFSTSGVFDFRVKHDHFFLNDEENRYYDLPLYSYKYTERAKILYYGTKFGKPQLKANEVSPRMQTDHQFYKRKLAKKLLLCKSKLSIKNIFFKSFRNFKGYVANSLASESEGIARYRNLFYRRLLKSQVKDLFWKANYPAICLVKKTHNTKFIGGRFNRRLRFTFPEFLFYQQFRRHPSSQSNVIKKYLSVGMGMDSFFGRRAAIVDKIDHSLFYKLYWRYFKFKIEKFFYNQINTRVHVWFLNVWDIFLNSIDALWRWSRYEDRATYFLTKKGQRFLIEDREDAQFYVRTLALTVTMVGGAKLFMDKISIMMKRHRNNWAFILHTAKTLRMCINYFWFRFFVNYKITLQGKIGGFLRAQKKIFKKGNISIENKESAITYYRGFPVTRFGSYNLSFWLQYRIPNLIEKFGDSEYIDTMKVLLSMYSVPWLAGRLHEIIKKVLHERAYVLKRKLAQFDRRRDMRAVLIYDYLKVKKYHYKYSSLKDGTDFKYKKLKDIVLRKKVRSLFTQSRRKKIIDKLPFRSVAYKRGGLETKNGIMIPEVSDFDYKAKLVSSKKKGRGRKSLAGFKKSTSATPNKLPNNTVFNKKKIKKN